MLNHQTQERNQAFRLGVSVLSMSVLRLRPTNPRLRVKCGKKDSLNKVRRRTSPTKSSQSACHAGPTAYPYPRHDRPPSPKATAGQESSAEAIGARTLLDDVDRHDLLKTLAEACQKTDWQVRLLPHAPPPGHLSCHDLRREVVRCWGQPSPWRVAAVAGRAWRAKPDGSEWGRPAAGPLTLPPGDLGW